jgi:hypothetical protein
MKISIIFKHLLKIKNYINIFFKHKKQLKIPIVISGDFNSTKIVKVKITYPYYEDIIEYVNINVPIELNEEDKNKFIAQVIEQDYAYLYGK